MDYREQERLRERMSEILTAITVNDCESRRVSKLVTTGSRWRDDDFDRYEEDELYVDAMRHHAAILYDMIDDANKEGLGLKYDISENRVFEMGRIVFAAPRYTCKLDWMEAE